MLENQNVHVLAGQLATGWTWYNAAAGNLATLGGDAAIWLPIVVQVLSFIAQLLQQRKRQEVQKSAE